MKAITYCIVLLLFNVWMAQAQQIPSLPTVPTLPTAPSLPGAGSLPQPAPRGSSVKNKPAENEYPNVIPTGKEKPDKEPWVVYSDRDNNTTYVQPGGVSKMKTMGFMESFYVINEHDGFLQLVKYDPSIIGGKIFPRRIGDVKKASYYGWAEKSKFLLGKRAFVDSLTLYSQKYLSVLKSPQSMLQCAELFHNDSIKVLSNPNQGAKVRGYLAFHQYIYVYKCSADKRFYLIGINAQFTPDGVGLDILGWVSTLVVQEWGSRLYFSPQDSSGKNASFYTMENARVRDKMDYPVGLVWEDTWSAERVAPWCAQLPVKGKVQQNQNAYIKTELPITLYDKSKRNAFGVDGNTITYVDFKNILNHAKVYNVVFVIEGNSRMGSFFPYLSNILQSTQSSFNQIYPGARVSYGVVTYTNMEVQNCKTNQRVTDALPLTTNYDEIAAYLRSMLSRSSFCNTRDNGVSAMYPGLLQATRLLKKHEDENNIIVLIGSVGNENEDASALIAQISSVNARLLSFQARNINFISANNFVLQSQNIIIESAKNLSYTKRKKLVSAQDIKEQLILRGGGAVKNMFFLNYPTESMVQGGVMFPEKGKNMAVRFLQVGLDSLIKQISVDNNHIISKLSGEILNVNFQNESFNPLIRKDFEQAGLSDINNDGTCFKSDHFIYTKSVATPIENKTYKLVLSTDEYNALLRDMQILGGTNYNLEKRASRRNLYKQYVDKAKEAQVNSRKKMAVDNMRIADALSMIIGYPVQNNLLQLYSVRDLNDHQKLPKDIFVAIIKYIQSATENMIDHAEKNKFQSNGVNYYVLSAPELP